MNEKKSNGFAALILSVVVALVAVFGVKFAGGTAALAEETPGGGSEGGFTAGTYTATEDGFNGDVTVTITFGDDGTITDVVIDGPGETPEFGGNAITELQASILENQAVPTDVVSGASVTSGAVIAAAQSCFDQAAGAAAGSSAGGTYTATEKGYGGDVTVTMTVDGEGTITDVVIEGPDETPGIGAAAIEQIQADILENQAVPTDVVSGATYSSNAAIAAAQSCLDQAAAGGGNAGGAAGGQTYTATEKGYGGDVTVTMTIADDGTITDVVIEGPDETPGIGAAAIEQIQADILENQAVPTDVVSGATYSSNAAIAAAQSCLDQAAGN